MTRARSRESLRPIRPLSAPAESSKRSSLVIGAIGVVFGDIGTSPLYTLRQCFAGEHPVALTTANVLGILSIIFSLGPRKCWTLTKGYIS